MHSGMFVFTAIERIVFGQPAATALRAEAERLQAKRIFNWRFSVGFGAGGGNDMIARTLSRKLAKSMGQQVIVENRAGGAGIVAAVIAAKAPSDGYTLFAGSISTLATNVSMHAKLPYDPLRDFAPVTVTTMSPYLFAVKPVRNVWQLRLKCRLSRKPACRITKLPRGRV